MKRILVFIFLFAFSFLYAQENSFPVKVWEFSNGTDVSSGSIEDGLYVSYDTVGTVYSQEFNLFNQDFPNFEQELAIVLKIDSLTYPGDTTKTDVDSLAFFPMFWVGQSYGYFTGDTINWSAAGTDVSIDSTNKIILLPESTGLTYLWKTTPTITALGDSAFVQNIAWEKFKLRMDMIGDSNYVNISCDIIVRQTK